MYTLRQTLEISDSQIEDIKRRFGFDPAYDIRFLRLRLEQSALDYYSYSPPATVQQQADALQRIWTQTDKLLAALGRGVKFPDVEPVGIRRPLHEMRDKAKELEARYRRDNSPRRGNKVKHGLDSFVWALHDVFVLGTGKDRKSTWDNYERRVKGDFFEFVKAVAKLYDIRHSDSSIRKAIHAIPDDPPNKALTGPVLARSKN